MKDDSRNLSPYESGTDAEVFSTSSDGATATRQIDYSTADPLAGVISNRPEVKKYNDGEVDVTYCLWGLLHYELTHMRAAAELVARFQRDSTENTYLRNFCIESCLTHIRNIDEILFETEYEKKFPGAITKKWKKIRDTILEDEFAGREYLESFGCSEKTTRKIRDFLKKKIARCLSHITPNRVYLTDSERKWPLKELTEGYSKLLREFVETLPAQGEARVVDREKVKEIIEITGRTSLLSSTED